MSIPGGYALHTNADNDTDAVFSSFVSNDIYSIFMPLPCNPRAPELSGEANADVM